MLAVLGSAVLAGAFEKPDLAVEGPGGSTWRVEISNRLRGEFVDWFDPGPKSPSPRFRYEFLGERFQAGVRVTHDPIEVFLQYQHTVLDNVAENAVGPGGVYFANTNGAFRRRASYGRAGSGRVGHSGAGRSASPSGVRSTPTAARSRRTTRRSSGSSSTASPSA
jgi:hypothetical protein